MLGIVMDKFAVDIEKVLDEFEYNEGREEAVLPTVIRNHSFPSRTIKPPAASYRRPSFEPINLADADFAAAPSSVQEHYSISKQKLFQDSNYECISENEFPITSDSFINCGSLSVQNKASELIGHLKSVEDTSSPSCIASSEDTPDLLEPNILKSQNGLELAEELESRLPDITSVRGYVPEPTESKSDEVFDLIKPHTAPLSSLSDIDDLPPVVDICSVVKEELPHLHVALTFDSVSVPESDLVSYLDNLDIETEDEILDDRQLDVDETECVSNQVDSEHGDVTIKAKEVTNTISCENVESTSVPELDLQNQVITTVNEPAIVSNEHQHPESEITSTTDVENISVFPVVVNENPAIPSTTLLDEYSDSCSQDSQNLAVNPEPFDCVITSPNSDELQNLQNLETEREEIDNRDNEEKAELAHDGDAEPASDYFYQSEATVDSSSSSSDFDVKPSRPSSLPLPQTHTVTDSEESPTPSNSSSTSLSGMMSPEERTLGKVAPYWVPDTEADLCMLCSLKFNVIKRRHHCRACGLVLCSKCCNLKAPLEYMQYAEARVCQPCFNIIYRVGLDEGRYNRGRQPNPNNPMEYCSTVPPLQQVSSHQPPPAVFVPTSVLKRQGRAKSDTPKQVMFSDGIRPGGDLTELDGSHEVSRLLPRRSFSRKMAASGYRGTSGESEKRPMDPVTQSFIPSSGGLPPAVSSAHPSVTFSDQELHSVDETPVKFAINYNLFVNVKKIKLDCCVNRDVWSVSSEGLALVGQDEVALVLETLSEENLPHVDIFNFINHLWKQAALGSTTSEMSFTSWYSNNLFSSAEHSGFLYIRPSLQCTTNLLTPAQPYLIAILIHRWETCWARLFPLRLILRMGAEYRYYPCPLVSVRNRQPLYTEIGHTIMKILVDFRKYSYSLATVRGLLIHVEDRQTTILFPRNRYDQVVKALNNSNESVLAFGANLSLIADSHLVCIQGTNDENTYHTEAINIHNKPRKVTGASFVVFNGALKPSSGLSGKSCIVEDGLMVHLAGDRMSALRAALRSMTDFSVSCGPNDEETVLLQWTDDDTNFNKGVRSCIDGRPLDGVPSIRVHNGTDYPSHSHLIRWTEVFILQCEDSGKAGNEPLDISRVSESLSRATCSALVPLLDSLATASLTVLSVRANIHQDTVGYEAGSKEQKLPVVYMKRLDEELVPVLHQAALTTGDSPAILELVFRVMNLA